MNWKNITIKQYNEIFEILKDNTIDDSDNRMQLLSVIEGKGIDYYATMDYPVFLKELKKLDFIGEEIKPEMVKNHYRINNKRYDACLSPAQISAGQYMDFINHLKNKKEMAYQLSAFLVPHKKEYGDYNIMEVINDINNNLSIVDATTLTSAFFLLFQIYVKSTLTYLVRMLKKEMKKPLMSVEKKEELIKTIQLYQDLVKNGGGGITLIK